MKIWSDDRRVLKGNLHAHTTKSDGRMDPEDVMELYRAAGYDFLAITDHRKVSTPTAFRNGLLAIQSIEFDFNLVGQVMHIVGIGVPEEISGEISQASGPQAAIDAINAAGGFAILAHPAWSLNTPATIAALRGVGAAEIYNTVSGLPWNADRADSSSILDMCAASGQILNLVASDDAHFYNGDACVASTMVAAEENTPEAIKAALRQGDFYATLGPRIHSISLEDDTVIVDCSPARAIWFPSELPWGSGRVFTGEDLTHAEYRLPARSRRFVRVVVEDEQGRRAWSNPIALHR